jgi:hypothetical protein
MEYKSVTQNVLLHVVSILKNAKELQNARRSWHIRYTSGIDHGNSDNNLESHCTVTVFAYRD